MYHGIDLSRFTFRADAGEYLLFFGRIHPDKGAYEAIQIARQTGRKLILAGVIQDEAYYREQVEPYLDGDQVTYVGSADPARRDELLGGALALLHPIAFDEPFGLSVVEAMACGTPVVAFDRGSMREVIADGETGFLVHSVEEAVAVVGAAGSDGPWRGWTAAACRAHVERISASRRWSTATWTSTAGCWRRRTMIQRFEQNPILTPADVPYPVATVHNAGAVKHEGRYLLLFRSHRRNGRSIIGLAESDDGFHFSVRPEPFLLPATEGVFAEYEEWGVEDVRICPLEGEYLLTYSAYSRHGVRVALARTTRLSPSGAGRPDHTGRQPQRRPLPGAHRRALRPPGPTALRALTVEHLHLVLAGPHPLG